MRHPVPIAGSLHDCDAYAARDIGELNPQIHGDANLSIELSGPTQYL